MTAENERPPARRAALNSRSGVDLATAFDGTIRCKRPANCRCITAAVLTANLQGTTMEYKPGPNHGIEDRTVTGLFAVAGIFDNSDGWSNDDRSILAFSATINGQQARVKFLWQHDGNSCRRHDQGRCIVYRAQNCRRLSNSMRDATGNVAVTANTTKKANSRGTEGIQRGGDIDEMSCI